MKNGLIFENDELIYYKDNEPYHAGIIEHDGDIYYIGKYGRAIRGMHVVHREMAHGLVAHGTYTFGEDYKLVQDSYIAPKKQKKSKKRKKASNQKKNFLMSKTNRFNIVIVCIVFILMIALCVVAAQLNKKTNSNESDVSTKNNASVSVTLPRFDGEILLCSSGAKSLYEGKYDINDAIKSGEPYRPVVFNYSIKGADGLLTLSENADLTNPKSYILSSQSNSLDIHNLKTGTNYFYRVTVDGNEYTGRFTTAKSTRFVHIPGAANTRDIGGYTNLDGKTVKQGYIIRGSEIDGLVMKNYFLSKDNVDGVQRNFGFVYELDLRSSDLVANTYYSRLGQNVRHHFYTSPAYGQIFNSSYAQSLRDIFHDMADPSNYPMYLHCSYGVDQTGTIIFLLQGILNMSEEEMMNEYLRSAYSDSSIVSKGYIEAIVSILDQSEKETINEQIEEYLVDTIGVTKEDIESIRNILLEK